MTGGLDEDKIRIIDKVTQELCNDEAFSKWFSDDTIRQLYIIKTCLLKREYTREREFFDLAYFAIIRRVSRAHDAEVRPHINKKKRQRDAIDAYVKKVNEMIIKMEKYVPPVKNQSCLLFTMSFAACRVDRKSVV